jgi:hypothetical protein
MPKIQSSSRTGTELVLFADERKALTKATVTCQWIADHGPKGNAAAQAASIAAAIKQLLKELPSAERTAPQTATSG